MSSLLTPSLVIDKSTNISVERDLPLKGKILVNKGDQVKIDQTIATAELPGNLIIIRVSEILGLSAVEAIKTLVVKEGEQVELDQPIAEHKGLFGLFTSFVKSPITGEIEFINESSAHVGIRSDSESIEVKAFIPGTVSEVRESYGATITACLGIVQGVFGVGGETSGVIEIMDEELNLTKLSEDLKNKVIVTPFQVNGEILLELQKRGATGLIAGSIADGSIAEYLGYEIGVAITGDEDVSMTVVITEGFGNLKMSNRALKTLSLSKGKVVSMTGATQVRAGAVRPTIYLPPTSKEEEENISSEFKSEGLKVGSEIRIIRYPYFGELAKVIDLPVKPEKIATGAITRVLKATTVSGNEIIVPRANVEIV